MASSDYATDDAGSSLNTNLATLLSMGFDGNQSKEALSKNEGDVLRAIDFLTSEMNEKKSTGAALLRSGGDADQLDTVGENDAKPPLPPSQIDELNECKRNKIESVHLEIVDDNVDAPKPPESTEAEGIHQTQTEKTIDYSDGEKKSIAFNGRKQLSMQKMLEPTVNVAELMSGSTHFVEENDPSPTCSPIHPDNTSSISQNTTNPIFVEVEATPVEDQNTIYDAILVPEDPRPEYNVDESRENTNPPPRWKRYQVLILMALILIIGVLLGTMISFGLSKNGSNNVQNELKLPGVDGSDPMGEGTENYLTNAPTPDADSGGKSPASLISSSLEPTSNPTSSRIASATPTFSAKISSKPPTTEPSQPPYRPIATTTPTSRKSAHPTQPPTPLPSRTPTNPPTPFPFALHSSHPTPNPSRPVHPAVKPILDILKPSRPISPPTGRPNTPTAQETPAPWSQSIPGSPPFLDFPIPGFPIPGVPSDFEESETSDEPDLSKPPYEVGQTCIGEDCTIVGRPYYDESGTLITAKSKLTCMGASQHTRSEWSTGEFCSTLSTKSKQKSRNHLGLDWTNRALGEHASIASFSAFSITLMTNGAPTSLVEESLEAGLDEIRHAKTSFEIASVLLGKEVGPGPLPESHVSFDGNLTKMAFAIAQEGCIDETFSAIAAYSEAVYIESIMQGASGKTPYSEIDQATLLWIRDELQIIGAEESKHSLLAWRAFSWVCDIDLHICEMVWENVMTKSNLEKALKIHLGLNFESNVDFAEIIAEQGWSVVHSYTTEDQLDEWVLGLFRTSSHELR